MFLGEYKHGLDAKGRIFIPSKFRDELGKTFVITKGTSKCITAFPMDYWQNVIMAKIESLPMAQATKIKRFIYPAAVDVELDSQGRTLITQNLREYAGIDKNATIIGMGNYIEIWSEDSYTELASESSSEEVEQLMIELGF